MYHNGKAQSIQSPRVPWPVVWIGSPHPLQRKRVCPPPTLDPSGVGDTHSFVGNERGSQFQTKVFCILIPSLWDTVKSSISPRGSAKLNHNTGLKKINGLPCSPGEPQHCHGGAPSVPGEENNMKNYSLNSRRSTPLQTIQTRSVALAINRLV